MSDLPDKVVLRVSRLLRRAENGGPEGQAAARVRSAGILFRLRRMPPALPAHEEAT